MKLILANNQSPRFRSFYDDLKRQSSEDFDYSGYNSLLFIFDSTSKTPVKVINLETKRQLTDYSGVYINGYLDTYELAAAVAIACEANEIGFFNHELSHPASLSKLTMYAKLASKKIPIPYSIAGTKRALNMFMELDKNLTFPMILKRADADRGIDNFMVKDKDEAIKLLASKSEHSLWVLQEFINNHGYYLVSFYLKPAFSIYRERKERPDHDELKSHMYKPSGGANASLIPLNDLPEEVMRVSKQAVEATDRQIASVDCLYDETKEEAYVLEVNYNPQLVTIETFKEVRIQAFVESLKEIG